MVAISPEVLASADSTARRIRSFSASEKNSFAPLVFIHYSPFTIHYSPFLPFSRDAPPATTPNKTAAESPADKRSAKEPTSPAPAAEKEGQKKSYQEADDTESNNDQERQAGKDEESDERQADGTGQAAEWPRDGAEEDASHRQEDDKGE